MAGLCRVVEAEVHLNSGRGNNALSTLHARGEVPLFYSLDCFVVQAHSEGLDYTDIECTAKPRYLDIQDDFAFESCAFGFVSVPRSAAGRGGRRPG